jgi:hypothetical protein
MTSMHKILITAACLGTLAVAAPASAQPSDSNISFQSGLLIKKPKPGAPDVKAQPLAWPRLDAGAVLCRSEDDLNRLARRRSGQTIDGPVECQVIRVATPITIVQRRTPGQTEVKPSTGQPWEDGWTDAWLPEKAPATATSVSR